MTFTDSDLKRLKERYSDKLGGHFVHREDMASLLARLEAAEKIVSLFENKIPFGKQDQNSLEAWRKAAGK